jgi:chromosome partitioning protein
MEPVQQTDDRVVARGQLEEFGTVAVLQALSLSRQYTAVELLTKEGRVAGRVTLKSGMVLDAVVEGSSLTGAAAFRALVSAPLHSFQVERLPPTDDYPAPIGQLSAQLSGPISRPVPVRAPSEQSEGESIPDVVIRESQRPPPAAPRTAPVEPARARPVRLAASSSPTRGAGPRPATALRAPVVGIASPKGGCGKTTIALNLAVSLAKSGLRVVLIDADPNGDVLSSIASRERVRSGVFDAITEDTEVSELEMDTAIPGLRVIPAMGDVVPQVLLEGGTDSGLCRRLFDVPARNADLVLVDLPAGMFGMSSEILGACSHVLGVLQAEAIPKRSFEMFRRGLDVRRQSPEVVGVILNMFRRNHSASVSVLVDAGLELPDHWVFETSIPRNDAFLDASAAGMPLTMTDGDSAAVIALLFDALAAELRDRLGLSMPAPRARPASFLV